MDPKMYQGVRLPHGVLKRSERIPTSGVVNPSVSCPESITELEMSNTYPEATLSSPTTFFT